MIIHENKNKKSRCIIIVIIIIFNINIMSIIINASFKEISNKSLNLLCETLNESIKTFVISEYFNNRQGWHIVDGDITYIRQHKMVSYENKQTPFLKSKRRSKRGYRERERERERGR
jgi:regulatory protein YycI of two-component signal transduction system YycFG